MISRAPSILTVGLVLATLACPIQRPPVPIEYYDFRADLQLAITDTAGVEMNGLTRMQTALEHRLTELAAITTTDTLFATLEADRELRPLAGAVATTLRIQLDSKHVGGSVRSAFRTVYGQRLAVDAIVVGLGRALYFLRSEGAGTEGGATRR